MIVVSMLLVIVGAVTLVIGVFFGSDDNLTLVYVSIASCLLAGVFLIAGILRNRPSRKPVLSSDGGDATWSGATAWPGAGGPETSASPVQASTGVLQRDAEPAQPEVQIVTARPEAEEPAARPAEPTAAELADADDEDVVVVPKRAAEPLAGRAPAKKATAKKAPAKKAAAKKAPAKKAPAKKTAAKKTTAKKAPAKKTAAKKTTAKKAAPAKKTAAKKTTKKR